MNAKEAINYIESRGKFGIRLGLHTIDKLLSRLDNPQNHLKFIHVAGTNGKGSVCTMLSAILSESGYKTGLYTSPALTCFNERIQINGAPIPDDTLAQLTERVAAACESLEKDTVLHPTGFEIETALTLLYFFEAGCDICIMEVGMGGKLDATNIIPSPEVTVMMEIGLDHTEYLGNSLAAIAREKAGIIKEGSDVLAYPCHPEVADVFSSICAEKNVPLTFINPDELSVEQHNLDSQFLNYRGRAIHDLQRFSLSLLGQNQRLNCLMVLNVIAHLQQKGYAISGTTIKKALGKVRFPGRFEILHQNPVVLIDGAHNSSGIAAFVDNLTTYFPNQKATLFFGMLADKNIDLSLEYLMPLADDIYTLTPDSDRALSAASMASRIYDQYGKEVVFYNSVEEAIQHIDLSQKNKLYVFVGSLYMIGRVRKIFLER